MLATARGFVGHASPQRILVLMQLLEALATAFFRVFGITQPSDATRRRAAWFLLGILLLVVAGLTGVGVLLYHLLGR
jgi:hypothetical protein